MERGKAQTKMVTDLKDIRTYLMLDMMPVITGGVQEALDSGRLAEITQSPLVSEAVHPAMVKIRKVSCYLEDRNDFFADVQVMLTLHAKDEDGNVYVEYRHVVLIVDSSGRFFVQQPDCTPVYTGSDPNRPTAEEIAAHLNVESYVRNDYSAGIS